MARTSSFNHRTVTAIGSSQPSCQSRFFYAGVNRASISPQDHCASARKRPYPRTRSIIGHVSTFYTYPAQSGTMQRAKRTAPSMSRTSEGVNRSRGWHAKSLIAPSPQRGKQQCELTCVTARRDGHYLNTHAGGNASSSGRKAQATGTVGRPIAELQSRRTLWSTPAYLMSPPLAPTDPAQSGNEVAGSLPDELRPAGNPQRGLTKRPHNTWEGVMRCGAWSVYHRVCVPDGSARTAIRSRLQIGTGFITGAGWGYPATLSYQSNNRTRGGIVDAKWGAQVIYPVALGRAGIESCRVRFQHSGRRLMVELASALDRRIE